MHVRIKAEAALPSTPSSTFGAFVCDSRGLSQLERAELDGIKTRRNCSPSSTAALREDRSDQGNACLWLWSLGGQKLRGLPLSLTAVDPGPGGQPL